MAPIPWGGSASEGLDRLVAVVQSLPRTQLITRSDDYMHVEFRSALFRFVDDVEFWVDVENEQIHFRSASRVGYSDLGANRKRMANFVQRFQSQ